MNAKLKKNPYDLPRYVMNRDVDDLFVRRKHHVGDALEDACLSWVKHLCSAFMDDDDRKNVMRLLQEFMEQNLLPWIEVLSICSELRTAVSALHDIQVWLAKVGSPPL